MSNKVTINTGNIKVVRVSSPGPRGLTGPAGTGVANGFLAANSIGNPSIPTGNTFIPAGYNVLLYTSNANPSITIALGVDYTISAGASVRIVNMDNIGNWWE